jgi:hypothetical protein
LQRGAHVASLSRLVTAGEHEVLKTQANQRKLLTAAGGLSWTGKNTRNPHEMGIFCISTRHGHRKMMRPPDQHHRVYLKTAKALGLGVPPTLLAHLAK